MSLFQKQAIASLIANFIVLTTYIFVQWGAAAAGKFEGAGAPEYIGKSLLVLVVAGILAEIIVGILFVILHAVVTDTPKPDFTIDERDRMIEGRNLKWVVVLTGVGLVAGIGVLAFGGALVYVFHVIFGGVALGHIASNLMRLSHYKGL